MILGDHDMLTTVDESSPVATKAPCCATMLQPLAAPYVAERWPYLSAGADGQGGGANDGESWLILIVVQIIC